MSEHVKELKIQLDIEQTRSFELADEIKALQAQLKAVQDEIEAQRKEKQKWFNLAAGLNAEIYELQARLDKQEGHLFNDGVSWAESVARGSFGQETLADYLLQAAGIKQEKG